MAESSKKDKIIELVKELNVMELAELVKALEEEFGVSAAAPVAAVAGPAAGEAAKEEEEQTEFDVILTSSGAKKIQVIKVVRQITKLGLKESKALVDEAPKPVAEGVSKDEAQSIKEKIEAEGGSVEIK
ncbi:MAG: 50S ribosomal protein L7/L12 [Candidatus Celaenobacter antarcticus]|nr:50S ribosomal protein L7/L12 [Candidatus Celaenobacter antarcticus]MDP8315674.1 50S ribosomal protein L7/L12 [Candidatus Celaenobacter antarcticus]